MGSSQYSQPDVVTRGLGPAVIAICFVSMLPAVAKEPLRRHVAHVTGGYQGDLADGYGRVHMPYALARKYPNAATDWRWQWVFPQRSRCSGGIGQTRGLPHATSLVRNALAGRWV